MSPVRRGRTLSRRDRVLVVVLVAAAVVTADQVTKSLAVAHLGAQPVHLLGPFSLQLAYNTGVAFSVGAGLGEPVIVVVTVGLVIVLLLLGKGMATLSQALGVGLTLGGAIGNLSDRLLRPGGAVVDFIHPSFWATFNLADTAVVCGIALLALSLGWRGRGVMSASGADEEPQVSSR